MTDFNTFARSKMSWAYFLPRLGLVALVAAQVWFIWSVTP